MGAVGAIAVIFASKAAVDAAKAAGLPDGSYRAYIAPLIFGLAPVINTLVSLVWHPKPGSPWHFKLEHLPGWKLILGIVLVGLGAFLVLYAKERAESASKGAPRPAAVAKSEQPAEHPETHEVHYEWLGYVLIAGLAWGTYVPIVFYGGQELTGKPGELGGRLMSILCVGMAYFLLAVLIPSGMMSSGVFTWPQNITTSGLVFSGLAGVAGAVGAICVIFASKSAVDAAKSAGLPPASFRVYIAPLIFGVAPVINTLVSLFWHPQKGGDFMHFGLESTPDPMLWVGIVSVGAGAFLVLFAKEQSEAAPAKPAGAAK
jgi:predicted membrane channel-forming protein YqfA (hemolysin III family)